MGRKGKLKVLCIFSRLLGGKTFSGRLIEALSNIDEVTPLYLFYDLEDSQRYPVPRWAEMSDTLAASWSIRKKFRDAVKEEFDILCFQSYMLMPAFYELIKRLPTAVALDTTPALAHKLIIEETNSPLVKVRSKIACYISTFIFKKIFGHVDIFLQRTQWCCDSLESDYDTGADKLYVTYSPLDLSIWKPIERGTNGKMNLLFVGNDFKRKGGEFLLELYRRHLSDRCVLRIVSNDRNLSNMHIPNGVYIIQGITHGEVDKLIDIYQTSDLFLFPTIRDQLGLVLTEAISVGLPVVANDVGGIRELVKDNWNGYLMPCESKVEEWAYKVKSLIENPDQLKRFGDNSRKLAEEKLVMAKFKDTVENAVKKLVGLAKKES